MGGSAIDLIVIVVYLVGILLVGLLAVRNKTIDSHEYFLAGRTLKWPIVGSALFACSHSLLPAMNMTSATSLTVTSFGILLELERASTDIGPRPLFLRGGHF